ncbi:MAG: nucleotidyltransferase substrate binding protein [bacterium]
MQRELILKEFEDLKKANLLLKASVKKFKPYREKKIYSPEELEYYDSLAFRFEKCMELFLNFFKGIELFLYSEISDTLRDRLLNMQKLNIIDEIEFWMEARLLRNKISHSYLPEELKDLYNEIIKKAKRIFGVIERIKRYLKNIEDKGI